MNLSMNFMKANDERCTFAHHVNAPLFRRTFTLKSVPEKAQVTICGLGFYVLFVNGKNVTKGPLAPYISAPDDICYFDRYDITAHLAEGENVIGVMLGNGMQNAFGGFVWDFDKALWVDSVKFALSLETDGQELFCADESFTTHPSPITFDDLRMGCYYDANLEIPGWNLPGFDDSLWQKAKKATAPRGTAKLCAAEPIAVSAEIKPVSITKFRDGYIYDFGVNTAGVCRLEIDGKPGQKITLTHFEVLKNGEPSIDNISFKRPDTWDIYKEYNQKDVYICRGGRAVFVPDFTYHGFQYVFVEGIKESQATDELLTYLEMHSDLPVRGSFSCSDERVNKLYEMAHRSDLANFYYFPTDCPHREKNGWTGDASMSAEHMLQWLGAEKSFSEWLANIRACQNESGAIPGVVPTGGWGFEWGNGPAWDSVMVSLPFYIYRYTGNLEVVKENASMIMRYLHYITTRRDDRGLVAIGLGDWVQPKRAGEARGAEEPDSPLVFTDSAFVYDIAKKASFLFEQADLLPQAHFAAEIAESMKQAIRSHLIDKTTCTAAGNCQTSQAFALWLGLFDEEELPKAEKVLLDLIAKEDGHFYTGMIGLRCMFHVLTKMGESELAYKMITNDTYPGYGQWVAQGNSALRENFNYDEEIELNSLNHHFLGDIASWFTKSLAGLNYNPKADDTRNVVFSPHFVPQLDFASAEFQSVHGKIASGWKRTGEKILLNITLPEEVHGEIRLDGGFSFAQGGKMLPAKSGAYTIVKEV